MAQALEKERVYATLSEKERAEKEFQDKLKQFEAERAEFAHKQLIVEIQSDLASKGLPPSF